MKFVGTLSRSRFLEFKCQEVGRPYMVPWQLSCDAASPGIQPAAVTVVSGVPYAACLYNARIASAYHPRQNLRRAAIHPKAGRILLHPQTGEMVFTDLESGAPLKSLITPNQESFNLAPFTPGEIVIIEALTSDSAHYEQVELLEHWLPREDVPQRISKKSALTAVGGRRALSG